ncbi:MAG: YcxB family protein [Thermoleophilia bacterium]|nr:YcxB family protein [Thermoleophilia bacterium]
MSEGPAEAPTVVAAVRFTITARQFVQATRATVDRGGVALLALLTVTTLPLSAYSFATGTTGVAISCLLVGALVLYLLLDAQQLGPRRRYHELGLDAGTSTWSFAGDALHISRAGHDAVTAWGAFDEYRLTEDFLLLGRGGTLAEVAPLAVFDAEELRAVRSLLADRLPRVRSVRD